MPWPGPALPPSAPVAKKVRPAATERGVDLVDRLPAGLAGAGDGDRVAQILGNFLSNALRYAPAGSLVELVGARQDHRVAVGVRDRGPGLTPEQRVRVFDGQIRVPALSDSMRRAWPRAR